MICILDGPTIFQHSLELPTKMQNINFTKSSSLKRPSVAEFLFQKLLSNPVKKAVQNSKLIHIKKSLSMPDMVCAPLSNLLLMPVSCPDLR